MKLPLNIKSADDFQTPPEALKSLLPYLKKNWVIWECACGKGNLYDEFRRLGYKVFGSDIINDSEELDDNLPPFIDFLLEDKGMQINGVDCIVTNPPYSLKQQFLEKCYELEKPFALLLPLTTFETEKRQNLFKKYGLEVIFLPKRINFETPSGKGSGSWFATAWFTNGLKIGKELNFI